MTTAVAIAPADQATERQLSFLNSLLAERGLAPAPAGVTKREASRLIDEVKRTARPAVRPAPAGNMLAGIPLSKYSIMEAGVRSFWEVKEFRGTTYLRMLVGAPGQFTRVKVNFDRSRMVATKIGANPAAAALAFAEHYTCCAVCGADLSDPESVRLGLGPICRRRFNF